MVLHLADLSGTALVTADHVPPLATTRWKKGRPVTYRVDAVVPAGADGSRPEVVVLVGLAAGAKYPGALLVVPLAWVLAVRHGRRAAFLWPACAAAVTNRSPSCQPVNPHRSMGL